MNPPAPRRGRLLTQDEVRDHERRARRTALVVLRWLRRRGRSLAAAAARLGLHPATLQQWLVQWQQERLPAKHRGRPPYTLPRAARQQAIAALDQQRVRSVRSLRRLLPPSSGRNATTDLVRRHRFLRRKRHRRRLCHLEWHMPGAVWAIDGTWLPWGGVNGDPKALVIVDLGARAVLACDLIPSESAEAILPCLERATARFGEPLVIKWDNGSGFIAAPVQAWCRQRGITLLHSPVRRPSYNGGCEVRNRWAKARIVAAAHAAGRHGVLLPEDLAAACDHCAAATCAVSDDLRQRFQHTVEVALTALCAERGLATLDNLGDADRRSLERVAARRALEQCHILTIRGRDYRW